MDPLSFLYIALGVGFLILVVFICATLLYIMPMLRDMNAITKSAKEVADNINGFILQPAQLMNNIIESIRPFIENLRSKEKNSKKHPKE